MISYCEWSDDIYTADQNLQANESKAKSMFCIVGLNHLFE